MRSSLVGAVCLALCTSSLAKAAEVGEELKQVELRNTEDGPYPIPDFGKKVIALFYSDADVADLNDPLADAIKAKEFDKNLYRGMGVANLEDSKAPNFIIKSVIKGKIEKYKTTILVDPNLTLAKAWGFGDCNNTAVVVVVGPDKKVKFIHKGGVRGKEIESTVKMIEEMVNAMKAAQAPTEAAPAVAPAATP